MTPPPAIGRYRFVVMSALWITGVFLYLDRVAMSIAAPKIMDELGLSGLEMGFILGTFFWGYSFGQLIGGVASDRLKIRTWALSSYLVWCVAVAGTAFCHTIAQFTVARAVFGFAEGAVINPVTKLLNHWVFPRERGIAQGVQIASAYMGLVVGMPFMAWIVTAFGWREMFIFIGALTLVGTFIFWRLVYDHPREHPRIPRAEMEALEAALERDRVTYDPSSRKSQELGFGEGLRLLARSPAYWMICVAFFFISGIYYTNFSWLPGYLVKERGYTALGSGMALSLPYAAAAVGALLSGWIADKVGKRTPVLIAAATLTIPGILGLLAVEQQGLVIAMLCLMLSCNGAAIGPFMVLIFDLMPAQVVGVAIAVLVGLFGSFGGLIGPLVMGYSFDLTGSFAGGFAAMAGGLVVSIGLLVLVMKHEYAAGRLKQSRIEAAGDVPQPTTGH
ncbi:MAG TPA: MFS transporter [Steroidobacteraceae bacterium]|nr:MFS transporter [Steroidobacteraceae bacterium]